MSRIRKGLYILSWIPIIIIKLVLTLLGLIVVPIALATQHMTLGKSDLDHWPDFAWLWGNDEEGCPDWWLKRAEQEWFTRYWPRFWWYAVRNPVNNWRFLFKDVPLESCGLETNWSAEQPMEAPWMLRAGRQMAYRWVWNSWWAGYRRVWLHGPDKYSEVWIGWKLGSKVPGLGFALQFRYKRKVGQ